MKKITLLIIFGLFVNSLLAQYTLIPDTEFEQQLITQGIDTEGVLDGQVLTDDIDHITLLAIGSDPPITPFIYNLTGIEGFISLEDLRFSNTKVEQVDLSSLSNLKKLLCKFNALTSLDVSNNLLLENINIDNCPPGICDQENTLTEINLSNNVNLNNFFSANNFFFELDFSNNPLLESLYIHANLNQTTINLKNGNNISLNQLTVFENPNFTCIEVDDPVAATNGDMPPYDNWDVQEGIVFSDDCTLGVSNYSLAGISIYPNPVNNILYINNEGIDIKIIEIYDVLGKKVLVTTENTIQIDVTNLHSGLYLVNIQTDQGGITKKIMKE